MGYNFFVQKVHIYMIEKSRKMFIEILSPNEVLCATVSQNINLVEKSLQIKTFF